MATSGQGKKVGSAEIKNVFTATVYRLSIGTLDQIFLAISASESNKQKFK